MRTHQQIIKDHGALRLSRDLADKGVKVHFSTPQRWSERDSIPSQYWPALVELGLASINELAAGVKPRKSRQQAEAA